MKFNKKYRVVLNKLKNLNTNHDIVTLDFRLSGKIINRLHNLKIKVTHGTYKDCITLWNFQSTWKHTSNNQQIFNCD